MPTINSTSEVEFQSSQFALQNGLVHRKPPILMEAPAITWYLGFWKPSNIDRKSWTLAIDTMSQHVLELLRNLDEHIKSPNVDPGKNFFGFNNRLDAKSSRWEELKHFRNYETISATASIGSFTLRAQADISKEFWTVCFACSLRSNYVNSSGREDPLKELEQQFRRLVSFADGSSNAEANASRVQALFVDFVLTHVLTPSRNATQDHQQDPDQIGLSIGGKFLDFRGIILIDERVRNSESKRTRLGRLIAPDIRPMEHDWLRTLERIWPLVKSLRRKHERREGPDSMKPEYSVSRFQGSKALYISSLGATSPVEGDRPRPRDDPELSVRYVIVTAYESKWMLGRLLDRLHRAGTMRIAAVRDLSGVDKANRDLDNLNLNSDPTGIDIDHDIDRARALHRKLLEIRNLPSIEGGLEFRAYRSKYYLEQFKVLVRGLRVQRIVGFQPYHEFVFRRMHGNFETIALTYARYVEARREIDLLFQKIQAAKALSHQKSLNKAQQDIKGLMHRAEALILMTLVYYSGVIYGEILSELEIAHYKIIGFLAGILTALVLGRHFQRQEPMNSRKGTRRRDKT